MGAGKQKACFDRKQDMSLRYFYFFQLYATAAAKTVLKGLNFQMASRTDIFLESHCYHLVHKPLRHLLVLFSLVLAIRTQAVDLEMVLLDFEICQL